MVQATIPLPPAGALANTYGARCCTCPRWVPAGFGTTQRADRQWLTSCDTCKPVQRQAAPPLATVPAADAPHVCWGARKRVIYDARGIYAFSCCAICEQEKRARFRPEVFTDPDYACDEPVDD